MCSGLTHQMPQRHTLGHSVARGWCGPGPEDALTGAGEAFAALWPSASPAGAWHDHAQWPAGAQLTSELPCRLALAGLSPVSQHLLVI